MSSEIDQLIVLISNILQAEDKQLRDTAENNLVGLRASNPNELILAFMGILGGNYKTEHRNFAATQVRLCLSTFAPQTYTNLWDKLTLDNQNFVKTRLFEILYNQPTDSMKKYIADTLGQIAGSVLGVDPKQWPEFRPHLWKLFNDPNLSSVMAGFYVLESFLPFSDQFFKNDGNELYTLIRNGLIHENCKLKLAALSAFRSSFEVFEGNDIKKFKPLILDIFNAVYDLLAKDNQNEEGLENLSEMLEGEGKFFKSHFKELNLLLQNIFKIPKLEDGIKRMATEMLVDYSQKYPSLFRKNKDSLNGLLEMIFIHMIDIDSDITDSWRTPEEGYTDDDDDFETTKFGMNSIDRLICAVGDKEVLPLLSASIQKLLAHDDWRYKYTAIMALSQVGEYIEEVSHISSIIEMIAGFFAHPNPMLRYASCHAIGQISDDMQPKFQELYGDVLYPKLVDLLSDPIPRVISHAAACLTNFLEGMKVDKAAPLMDKLMELLIQHSNSGISLVKQSCLSTISSVAELLKSHFEKYVEVTVALLFHIIETHTKKQYKQLRGQSIETLTIIAGAIGADKFRPALDKLINMMIAIQESNFEQTDPEKTYLLSGWQRLCLVYGRELEGYLNRVLPSLFNLVKNVINNELQLVSNPDMVPTTEKEDKEKKGTGISTYETEEAEVAIAMLNVFIEQLKELYHPYVQDTVTLLCRIITEHITDDIREQACKCLPNLVSAVKPSNPQTAVDMTKYFMDTLVVTIEKESDPEVIIFQLETLSHVIEDIDMAFLTADQLSTFSEKILKVLKDSEDSKSATDKFMKSGDEDLDDEQKKLFDDEIKLEEEVQVAVSEVIGMLFKTHKDLALPIAHYFMNNVLPNVMKEGRSDNSYKFGIFLIDDMVEFLGYERLFEQWSQFSNILVNFTRDKNCELRQAACYGLGVLGEKTPVNSLDPEVIDGWLQALVKSSKMPKGNEKEKTYGHCRDNAISGIGRIIKIHGDKVNAKNYLEFWLTYLPLRFDKKEALIQHEFLLTIMQTNPAILINEDESSQVAGLRRILSIYGSILNNIKIHNDEIKKQIKAHMLSLQNVPVFMANRDQIWNELNEKEKQSITTLLK